MTEERDTMAEATVRARRGAGGRPTREEAVRREERVLDVASAMFLDQGFDGTAIDAIAAAAGIGKPSLYARYGDKQGLFIAVLRRRLEQWIRPFAGLIPHHDGALGRAQVREVLESFGRHIVDGCLRPETIALGRVLTSEATRFPELARVLHEEGWMQGVRCLAAFLEQAIDFSKSEVGDPELAADLFFSLMLGRLSRQALLGIPVDPRTLDTRVEAAVAIFLGSGFALR